MKVTESNLKNFDIILLIAFPIIAVFFSRLLVADTLTSIILFYVPLTIYFSLRTPSATVKTLVFSALMAAGFGIVFDYPAYLDNAWYVSSIFSLRIYGLIAWEDIIWTFFFVYSVVIFYEHFIDKAKHKVLEGKAKFGILLLILLVMLFFSLLHFKPQFLNIQYYLFRFGFIFMFLPVVAMLSYYRKLISGFFITGVYFFAHSLIYELTALKLNQWIFPGKHYIGWVELAHFRLPFEEFFFFIMIGGMTVLAYFEFFDVDKI